MKRFYLNHVVSGMDIPLALQESQLWARYLTSMQVAGYIEKCYCSREWKGESKEFIEQYRERSLEMSKKCLLCWGMSRYPYLKMENSSNTQSQRDTLQSKEIFLSLKKIFAKRTEVNDSSLLSYEG